MWNHGLHRPKDVVPVLVIDGLRNSSIAATTRLGLRSFPVASSTCRRSAGDCRTWNRSSSRIPLVGEYSIGHTPFSATSGRKRKRNRAPAPRLHGKNRRGHNGIIENYLDLKQELQRQGPHVCHRDRYRDRRAPRRARNEGRRARERRHRALLRCAAIFALVLISRRRAREDRRRQERPANRRRTGRRRVLRGIRHSRHPQPHARRGLSRRRGDGDDHAHRRAVHGLLQRPVSKTTSASCGTRSWPRRPATSTSCSRRSSSSPSRARDDPRSRLAGHRKVSLEPMKSPTPPRGRAS